MATTMDIRDLPARLEEARAPASAGREVILVDGPSPRARLVPFEPAPARTAGLHPDAIQAAPEFEAPLPDDFWTGKP